MGRRRAYASLGAWAVLFHEAFLRAVTWRGETWQLGGLAVPPRYVWALLGVGTFAVLLLAYVTTALLLRSERRRASLVFSPTLIFYLALASLLIETTVLLRVPSVQVALSALGVDFVGRILYEAGVLLGFTSIYIAVFPIPPLRIPPGPHGQGRWGTISVAFREAYKQVAKSFDL
jgi:hypothetical protein